MTPPNGGHIWSFTANVSIWTYLLHFRSCSKWPLCLVPCVHFECHKYFKWCSQQTLTKTILSSHYDNAAHCVNSLATTSFYLVKPTSRWLVEVNTALLTSTSRIWLWGGCTMYLLITWLMQCVCGEHRPNCLIQVASLVRLPLFSPQDYTQSHNKKRKLQKSPRHEPQNTFYFPASHQTDLSSLVIYRKQQALHVLLLIWNRSWILASIFLKEKNML